MVVRFEIKKNGGRTVILEHGEDICINCGMKRGDKRSDWYYFTGMPKGIYCYNCAVDPTIRVTILSEDTIFWKIDNWEYFVSVPKKRGVKNG